MKVTLDTNVLIRAIVQDDEKHGEAAAQVLRDATHIAIPLTVLCEYVWVLQRLYGFDRQAIAESIKKLTSNAKISLNQPAVAFGLDLYLAGGDFADGVIAFEGQWLGGETFVSFDKATVNLVASRGKAASLLQA